MEKLKKVVELSTLAQNGGVFEGGNRFVISTKNYFFSLGERNKRIFLEIVFRKKFTGDTLKEYAPKMTLINNRLDTTGFSLDNRGQVSLYKAFSPGEAEDSIAYAVVQYLNNAERFVVI